MIEWPGLLLGDQWSVGRRSSRPVQPGDQISPTDCASSNLPHHVTGIHGLVQLVESNQVGEVDSLGKTPSRPIAE